MEGLSFQADFGSGTDNDTVFSCISSLLDRNGVTNQTFWTLQESVADGGVAIAVLLSLILCLSFGWNLFIVIAYMMKYKLLTEPANIFLFSLAVIDLLVGLMLIPSAIVTSASGQFGLGNSDVIRCLACSIDGFSVVFLSLLSLYILTLLSIDRCLLLSSPIKYKQYCRSWHAIVAVVVMSIISFMTALPPVMKFGEWEFNRQIGICLPRWTPRTNLFYVALPLMQVIVLILVIATTNIWTYKIVSMFLKASFARQISFRTTPEEATQENFKHNRQQRQVAKVFGILLVTYIVSWTPIAVMFFVVFITEGRGIPAWIYTIGWFLYLGNPVIHPIIETFFIQKLRVEVGRVKRSVRRLSTRVVEKIATFDALKAIDVPAEMDIGNVEKVSHNNVIAMAS